MKRVLVVEDNLVHKRLYQLLCDRFGLTPVVVETIADACKKLESEQIDLCIFDWSLQNECSVERLKELRLLCCPQHMPPFVIVTGHAFPGDREFCLSAGADDYMSKPFSLQDFENLLQKWIGKPGTEPLSASCCSPRTLDDMTA